MALALKRKPLEVSVLSVLVTLRHSPIPSPVCDVVLQGWGGVSLCIRITLTDNEG